MSTQASNTAALDRNWLDTTNTAVQISNNLAGDYTTGYCYGQYWYPYLYTPTYTVRTDIIKIRLKLSEIERLREAARGDEALRATLNKFTPHIEVEVDF